MSDQTQAPADEVKTSTEAAPAAPASSAPPPADLAQRVEAALLTTDRPMTSAKLAEALGDVAVKAINSAIAALNKVYEKTERSFRIEQVAAGWQIMTLPQYADVLSTMHKARAAAKLSPAAMETLAIIAYRQPILRAEVESVRGVACGEVIRSLMERRLVKIVGRADEIGRPMLYGTSSAFLELFGLSSLKDLPKVEEFKGKAPKTQPPVDATAKAPSEESPGDAKAADPAAPQVPNAEGDQA